MVVDYIVFVFVTRFILSNSTLTTPIGRSYIVFINFIYVFRKKVSHRIT